MDDAQRLSLLFTQETFKLVSYLGKSLRKITMPCLLWLPQEIIIEFKVASKPHLNESSFKRMHHAQRFPRITDCITFISFCPEDASIHSSHFVSLYEFIFISRVALSIEILSKLQYAQVQHSNHSSCDVPIKW